jgi:hypothetical protein
MIGWSAQRFSVCVFATYYIACSDPAREETSISPSILDEMNRGTWASTGLALLFSLILWSSKA